MKGCDAQIFEAWSANVASLTTPLTRPWIRVLLRDLTADRLSDILTDMKVTSRDFQRDFARMKAKAAGGEVVHIVSGGEEFVFRAVEPKSWQGALKGKGRITGDLLSTGLAWETNQ